jgi:homoserine/homoserine lactone efflux protein
VNDNIFHSGLYESSPGLYFCCRITIMNYNLLVFSFTVLIISLVPGLNVMLIVSQSIHGGMKSSTLSVLGIVASNLIYLLLSLFGLGVVLLKFPQLFQVIKYGGVLFTLYSAWLMLKAGFSNRSAPAEELKTDSRGRYFVQGMLTVVSNPKSFIFWVTVLPGFVNPAADILPQVGLFGVVAILIDTFVLLSYGYLAGIAAPVIQRRSKKGQYILSGLILVAVAVWLWFS